MKCPHCSFIIHPIILYQCPTYDFIEKSDENNEYYDDYESPGKLFTIFQCPSCKGIIVKVKNIITRDPLELYKHARFPNECTIYPIGSNIEVDSVLVDELKDALKEAYQIANISPRACILYSRAIMEYIFSSYKLSNKSSLDGKIKDFIDNNRVSEEMEVGLELIRNAGNRIAHQFFVTCDVFFNEENAIHFLTIICSFLDEYIVQPDKDKKNLDKLNRLKKATDDEFPF